MKEHTEGNEAPSGNKCLRPNAADERIHGCPHAFVSQESSKVARMVYEIYPQVSLC